MHIASAEHQVLTAHDKPLFAWWTTAHTGALLLVGTAILMVRALFHSDVAMTVAIGNSMNCGCANYLFYALQAGFALRHGILRAPASPFATRA